MRLCSRPSVLLALPLAFVLHAPAAPLPPPQTAEVRPAAARATPIHLALTVTDPDGRPVTKLTQQNFTLLEDSRPQAILSLSKDDVPASIGILFDVSASVEKLPPGASRRPPVPEGFQPAGRVFPDRIQRQPRAACRLHFRREISNPISANFRPAIALPFSTLCGSASKP